MKIKCVSRFYSSSGLFVPGDIVQGNAALVQQLLNESPESFVIFQDSEEEPKMAIEDKKMKRITRKAE